MIKFEQSLYTPEVLKYPSRFLQVLIDDLKLKIGADGIIKDATDTTAIGKHLIELAFSCRNDLVQAHNDMQKCIGDKNKREQLGKLTKADYELHARILIEKYDIIAKAELAESLKYDSTLDDSELRRFLAILTGECKELDLRVMKHFMWQVKRKLLNRSVIFHIMPVFFSMEQGSGKSQSVQMLTKPFSQYFLKISADSFGDERKQISIAGSLVCLCDEMANINSNKATIEAIKYLITTDEVDVRQLYQSYITKVRQGTTFIGTSNKPLRDIINDPSGNRRMYQLNYALDINTRMKGFEELKTINIESIWRNIDENLEAGYTTDTETALALHEAQQSLIMQDSFMTFVSETSLIHPSKDLNTFKISLSCLYKIYKNFAHESGFGALNSSNFSSRLKALNVEMCFFKTKDKSTRGWKINPHYNFSMIDTAVVDTYMKAEEIS